MEKQNDTKFTLPRLILASGSPRRAEILNFVGWEFEKQVADIDESILPGENPADHVERLAQEKALAVANQIENGLILGADTTVVIDGEIIGKPVDEDDARQMLRLLSGKRHEVVEEQLRRALTTTIPVTVMLPTMVIQATYGGDTGYAYQRPYGQYRAWRNW